MIRIHKNYASHTELRNEVLYSLIQAPISVEELQGYFFCMKSCYVASEGDTICFGGNAFDAYTNEPLFKFEAPGKEMVYFFTEQELASLYHLDKIIENQQI